MASLKEKIEAKERAVAEKEEAAKKAKDELKVLKFKQKAADSKKRNKLLIEIGIIAESILKKSGKPVPAEASEFFKMLKSIIIAEAQQG